MIIAQLPEVEELPWGQELKAKWTAEGRVQGLAEGRVEGLAEGLSEGRVEARIETLNDRIEELHEKVALYDELHTAGELTDAGHASLKSAPAANLAQLEAELLRLRVRLSEFDK